MKVAQDKSPALISNAGGQVVDIQIGASREAQVMIMRVLTDTLYTNKPEAVWREYGCNAADANIEAGKPDIPIEITLPTRLSPEAIIRDFGYGMTESRMLDVYCKLGESTKRDSNAETGMIGIGAKAGYAYGDMFTVTSFNGGLKTVYQFFKDGGVPRMMLFSREESGAPEGTEIRVPVRAADIEDFHEAAEKTFRYFRISPIVHGGELIYKRGHPVFKGEDWALTGDKKSVAIMGNVGYKVMTGSLGMPSDNPARQLLDIGIELHFSIGALEIAATRESLQYKDDTKKAIAAKATCVVAELVAIFKAQIAGAPNFWEAKRVFHDAFEKLGSNETREIRRLVEGQVTWNGNIIGNGYFSLTKDKPDDTLVVVHSYSKNWRGSLRVDTQCDYVIPNEGLTIALNDLPKLNVPRSRVLGHFARNTAAKQLVVLTFKGTKAKTNFWKKNQMDGVPMVALSTLPPLLTANGTSTASAHRSKHAARAFVLDEQCTQTRYSCKTRSIWWTVEDVDKNTGKGVYVVVRGFKTESAKGGEFIEPCELMSDVARLRKHGLFSGKLYAFKRGKDDKLPKLGAGWVPLKQHVADEVKTWAAKYAQEIADYEETVRVDALLPESLLPMLPDCIAKVALIERKRMSHKAGIILADAIRHETFGEWCPRSLLVLPKASVDLSALQKQIIARYPMLKYFNNLCEKDLTVVLNYITLVETTGN